MSKLKKLVKEITSFNNGVFAACRVKYPQPMYKWARNTFGKQELNDDLHCTVCYSKKSFDYSKMNLPNKHFVLKPNDNRSLVVLGEENDVITLKLDKKESEELILLHKMFINAGASFDYNEYIPHITVAINYKSIDLTKIEPYNGKIVFSPVYVEEFKD